MANNRKSLIFLLVLTWASVTWSKDTTAVHSDTLSMISHFPVLQQTTDFTCGGTSALMILQYFGCDDGMTEMTLSRQLGTRVGQKGLGLTFTSDKSQWGTKLDSLYHYFKSVSALKIIETNYKEQYTSDQLIQNDGTYCACDVGNMPPTFKEEMFAKWVTAHIMSQHPILVEWNIWDGHWSVIIGINDKGTPDDYADDTLIFADPYDKADGICDGRVEYPLLYFFYGWNDRAFASRPWQLQAFMVIGKVLP